MIYRDIHLISQVTTDYAEYNKTIVFDFLNAVYYFITEIDQIVTL